MVIYDGKIATVELLYDAAANRLLPLSIREHTADQAMWPRLGGLACLLACATLSSAGILGVAREPPLAPYHIHGNAIMLCDVAVVVVVFVLAAVLAVDAQVC